MESARQIRENINNVIREIQPLVDTARSVNGGIMAVSSVLNRSTSQPEPPVSRSNSQAEPNESSIIIDISGALEGEEENENNHVLAVNMLNNNTPPDNTNSNEEMRQTVLETQQIFQVLLKYIPFILILIAKGIYDYHTKIFIIIALLLVFANANSTIKKETTKRHRRSVYNLFLNLVYIVSCLLAIHLFFDEEIYHFSHVLNLVLIRTFTQPLTVWNLLWMLTVTDFVLKLITVSVKLLLTMLPGWIMAFQKRGKIYLFIEALSQMFRSIATIQPWLYYLLDSYQGPEKIVAVFLSAFYMISKGPDLMSKVTFLKNASLKLLQNVAVGSSLSKEQLQSAGEHCPICHDEYDSPVLLQCRHIFCESCVMTWFDREQTCPLCRAKIVDDPSWRDGSTSYFIQIF